MAPYLPIFSLSPYFPFQYEITVDANTLYY
jgi:hypothetical protein